MAESGIQLVTASDTSCCIVSRAPIPQFQYKASDPSLAARIKVLDSTGDTPRIQQLPPVLNVHLSPPSVQMVEQQGMQVDLANKDFYPDFNLQYMWQRTDRAPCSLGIRQPISE